MMNLILPTDGHLAAHADDFLVPLDEVLTRIKADIPSDTPIGVAFRLVIRSDRPLGRSRCVPAAGRRTWWGFRTGRQVPSHLSAGEPAAVSVLTAWLRRDDADNVALLTVYPGEPAPREIHDPEMPEHEREASIAFWREHALLAPEPRAIWLVNALSLNMFGALADGATADLRLRKVPLDHARILAEAAESAVGHGDTAGVLAGLLGRPVASTRQTLALADGDCLLAGQYVGKRLSEGATVLPEGATILWYWVEVGAAAGDKRA